MQFATLNPWTSGIVVRIGLLLLVTVLSYSPQIGWAQDVSADEASLESILEMEISAASKYEQSVREAPASITVITAEDIERFGYHTLADALESVRGFYTRYDRNYAHVGVRGFSRPGDEDNRLLVLLDGQTTNEYVFGASYLGTDFVLDLDAIDRIEVVRGPGSALYGTSAMFAVVNIVSKKASIEPGLQVATEVGSFGQRDAAAAFRKTFATGVGVSVAGLWGDAQGPDLYYEEYDDPGTNNGHAEGKDWDRYYGGMGVFSYGPLRVQTRFGNREKGIPTGAWETVFNSADTWTRDQVFSTEARYEQDVDADKHLTLRSHIARDHYYGSYPYFDEDEVIGSFDESVNLRAIGEAQFRWDISSANRLIAGTEIQRHFKTYYRYWDDDETYVDFDAPFTVVSVYAQDEYQVTSRLALVLGARHDQYSTVGSATTPRAALLFHFSRKSTLKLLYGEAFRAPSTYELNNEDPINGYKASPSLHPEHIRTFEVAGEHQFSPAYSGTVSLYNYRMRDLIDQVVDPSDSLIQNINVGAIGAMGGEVEFQARLASGYQGYASYSYQHVRTLDTQDPLTNSPEHLVKGGLSVPVLDRLYATVALRYESSRWTVYETCTDPFFRADLTLHTRPLWHHWRLSAQVRNVFDATYALPGGFEHEQPTLRQDGRTVSLKVLYRL